MQADELLTMSYPRKVVETVINGLQDPINQHLIKLGGFNFAPELRRHFHDECEAWLDRIQRMRMKPSNPAGSFRFYYDLLYDYPFGGVELQNMSSMMDFIDRRCPGVGHNRTPEQMIEWLRDFHTKLAQRLHAGQMVLDIIPD